MRMDRQPGKLERAGAELSCITSPLLIDEYDMSAWLKLSSSMST
jgi:hypothetical protein